MVATAIARINDFARQIRTAMLSQREESEGIVSSLNHIAQVAEGNLRAAADLDRTVRDFAALAKKLDREIERFHLPESGPSRGEA